MMAYDFERALEDLGTLVKPLDELSKKHYSIRLYYIARMIEKVYSQLCLAAERFGEETEHLEERIDILEGRKTKCQNLKNWNY